ncbi:hypothetical protein HK101_009290 [Irineochytrium annulatum]|nr:hypothetical protein HK101_009290 [Irineochytrium annulatum]
MPPRLSTQLRRPRDGDTYKALIEDPDAVSVTDSWEMSRMDRDETSTVDDNESVDELHKDSGERNDSEWTRRLSLGSNPQEMYESLDIIAKSDDVSIPALTLRVWSVSPYIAVILSYPMGLFLARVLPDRTIEPIRGFPIDLNPGPFNQKEHTLVFVFASTGAIPVYALYNIIGQKYMLGQNLSTFWCLVFAFVTQSFGYSLAGLCRRYLVRPAVMVWPANLSTVALLNSLSLKREDDKDPHEMSRFSATQGLGMFSLTFDWSIITTLQPITTPLWALWNQAFGLWLALWVIVPFLFSIDAFGNDTQLGKEDNMTFYLHGALNTPALFTKDGTTISAASLVMTTPQADGQLRYHLNQTLYDTIHPIRISTYFAVEYFAHFAVFTSALTHVALWHGRDIVNRTRTSVAELDQDDEQAVMMDHYPRVPDWWFISLLVVNVVLGIIVCKWGGFDLPWWG